MPPIVEVQDLVKRYRNSERNAVDGISFTVEPAQLFALLGPNGAGKTTTISILTTTLSPTAGTVRIAGFDAVRQASEVRRRVGIIFQNPSLDQNLTAEENVRFHASLYGLYPFRPAFRLMPPAYKAQVRDLADLLGLGDDMFRPVRTFSGGMKRKLEIVRSLIHRPQVLFLDEPTVGLDPASRRSLWQYLTEERQRLGTTVFLTTHYLEEAESSDTVCIINHGKIVSYGSPEQVKADLAHDELVVDAPDREQLRTELVTLGLQVQGDAPFRISLNGHNPHQVLRSIESPLTLVRITAPTLEDAYLNIIARDLVASE